MKRRKGKLSKRTLGLLVAVLVLAGLSGGMGARAALTIRSQDYRARFALDHINVALTENGKAVGEMGDVNEMEARLLGPLEGKIEPGRVYKEEIAARNESDIPEYVRLTIRKYWRGTDGKKDTTLDPALIELTYDDGDYNTGAWQLNDAETTTESKTYYLTNVLAKNKDSDPVVNKLRINDEIVSEEKGNFTVHETKEGSRTIYTYTYKYNGYRACIEADVQSIQTHNPNDAIESLWGVQNVSASGSKLTVGN